MTLDECREIEIGDAITFLLTGTYGGIAGEKGVVINFPDPWTARTLGLVLLPETVQSSTSRATIAGDHVRPLLQVAPGLTATGKVLAVSDDGLTCAVQWPDRFAMSPIDQLVRVKV